jgi:uncharacterized protein YrrD
MIKGRQIISLPVVTENEKKQIGEVRDIIYDPRQNNIIGYLVDESGWLKAGRGFLHEDIIKRDNDCIVVKDSSVIKNITSIPELKSAMENKEDIRDFKVENQDGQCIGIIKDLVLDENTNIITGYELSDGFVQDLLDGRTTISNSDIDLIVDKVVFSGETENDSHLKGESV